MTTLAVNLSGPLDALKCKLQNMKICRICNTKSGYQ